MSRWIRLSDGKGRHARVRMESKEAVPSQQFQAEDGREVKAARIIKSPLHKTYSCIRFRCNDDRELARLLMESDPEIDFELRPAEKPVPAIGFCSIPRTEFFMQLPKSK